MWHWCTVDVRFVIRLHSVHHPFLLCCKQSHKTVENIVHKKRNHEVPQCRNTYYTHNRIRLVEVRDKVLLLLLKFKAVTAGNCVTKQKKPVIIFTPSISGIWGRSLVFHFYPHSALSSSSCSYFYLLSFQLCRVHNCRLMQPGGWDEKMVFGIDCSSLDCLH